MAAAAKPREPWDYEAFVRHYNAFAREASGYNFDFASAPPAETLRHYYESPIWDSLRDFARTRFQMDQQY